MTPGDPTAPEQAPPDPLLVTTLPSGQKVKRRMLRMRACNEKDEKGKLCAGHLKRWHAYGPDVAEIVGKDGEIYRCENCKTLYLPNPDEVRRTRSLAY